MGYVFLTIKGVVTGTRSCMLGGKQKFAAFALQDMDEFLADFGDEVTSNQIEADLGQLSGPFYVDF
ncbi:MAG: hypothetical protein ACFB11_21445 [Paracoccaceae bacterium]